MAPDTGRDSGEQKAWSQRRVERSPEAGMSRLYPDRVRLETRVSPRKVTIPALGHGRWLWREKVSSPVGQKSWGSRASSLLPTSQKAGGLKMFPL